MEHYKIHVWYCFLSRIIAIMCAVNIHDWKHDPHWYSDPLVRCSVDIQYFHMVLQSGSAKKACVKSAVNFYSYYCHHRRAMW